MVLGISVSCNKSYGCVRNRYYVYILKKQLSGYVGITPSRTGTAFIVLLVKRPPEVLVMVSTSWNMAYGCVFVIDIYFEETTTRSMLELLPLVLVQRSLYYSSNIRPPNQLSNPNQISK